MPKQKNMTPKPEPKIQPKTDHATFVKTRVERLRILAFGLVAFALIIVGRLFFVQVANIGDYEAMAKRQYERRAVLEAERGVIYDRNMQKIAVNLINYSFAADPSFMNEQDKARVAENFSRVFGKPKNEYLKRLNKPGAFVWLERRVNDQVAEKVNDSVKGLIKLQSLRRHYPFGKAGAALLGMTNIDNEGSAGIELDQQATLGGKDGWAILQADALGRLYPNPDYPHEDPVNGKDVVLTVDMNYQMAAYQVLEKTVKDYNADNATAVLLSPQTGEILAIVNYPGLDPNAPETFDAELLRNRAITDLYEPGSAFKAFSAVAALEEKVRNPEDRINCEWGKMTLYGHVIHDTKKHGTISFTEVVQKSSNIGIIKTTDLIGSEKLYQYVRAFGFGNETGVDLEGETRGLLSHPSTWSGLSRPMISIGQEIGVTPLQMVTAYSAIANGGTLYKPYIIKGVHDPLERTQTEHETQLIRTVASQETMQRVSRMLKEVVEGGTGHRAAIKGIEVAGKTGTAQKIDVNTGRYAPNSYVASFAGFFPVQNPQVAFIVTVDNPRRSIWGEASAANAARQILEKIINSSDDFAKHVNRVLADLDQDTTAGDAAMTAPDVKYLNIAAAKNVLDRMNLEFRIAGTGDMVTAQEWTYDPKLKQNILLLTTGNAVTVSESDTLDFRKKRIPDVRGLSMRMAMNKLYESGIDVKIKGNGYVIAQYPRAGAVAKNGESVIIQCKPNL